MSKSKARSFRKGKDRQRRKRLETRKRRIKYRLRDRVWKDQPMPMFSASNIHYELSEKTRGLHVGGIGAIHKMARHLGLIEAINGNLHLLKAHLPYHESDHVLNIAYNLLAGGTCLEDIERLRHDEVYMDAVGAQRIPDPTTSGDFCRRFSPVDIEALMDLINEIRLLVWRQQGEGFFQEAILDADGTLVETTGNCKEGMDFSYKKTWGFHPLLVSLANTQEPLYLVNRSGNRPSSEGAAERFDQAIALCRRAGFRRVLLRGDTAFSQTRYLDRWNREKVSFVFGMDASPNLVDIASELPRSAWDRLSRPAKYEVATRPRQRPEDVKQRIVEEREFKDFRLEGEDVAEFDYSPTACKQTYRMVVVRKRISVEQGQEVLFKQYRYFFYITNDRKRSAEKVVFLANGRCDQENLIQQLKTGVRALHAPVENLTSNWAYMVMASLAWGLKAWFALLLPESGRWREKYKEEKSTVLRMEFKTFLSELMLVPAQIIRQGRKIVYRLLSWTRWQHVFLRFVDQLETEALRC